MQVYHGKSVFGGIAIGRILVYGREEKPVKPEKTKDAKAEMLRYRKAAQTALKQLDGLYQKALQEAGEDGAAIFEIHRMMLEDNAYGESVENIIYGQQVKAEYAVARTGEHFARMFADMEDAYMRERAADVKDISERLLAILGGEGEKGIRTKEPVILLAEDLSPSETVRLGNDSLLCDGPGLPEFPHRHSCQNHGDSGSCGHGTSPGRKTGRDAGNCGWPGRRDLY